MRTDSIVRNEGMDILINHLGNVDAERFISMIIKEPFDYTEWQKEMFKEKGLEELSKLAMGNYDK